MGGVNRVCPDITRNHVYNELRRQDRIANQSEQAKIPTCADDDHVSEAEAIDGVVV